MRYQPDVAVRVGVPSVEMGLILLLQSEAGADEVPVDTDEGGDHAAEYGKRNPNGDIGSAEESVAEAVDKVKDRIDIGEALSPAGK